MKIPQRQHYHRLASFEPRIDENGQKHCLNCNAVLTGRRKRYCSDKCGFEFWAKHSWPTLRLKMIRQSNYTCVECGFHIDPKTNAWAEEELVVDHIKPIFEGGEEFDEDNLQVLCKDCNKKKTAEDLKRYHKLKEKIKHLNHVSDYRKLDNFVKS